MPSSVTVLGKFAHEDELGVSEALTRYGALAAFFPDSVPPRVRNLGNGGAKRQ
jgi:hypothetical protein